MGGHRPDGRDDNGDARRQPVVYCLIPADLAGDLHEPLRKHFAGDPSVRVVVERRGRERRATADRRTGPPAGRGRSETTPPSKATAERRRVHALAGRRVGERRAPLIALEATPPLPRRARRHAGQLTFVERLEPSTEHAADLDTGRLVIRFQAGDPSAYSDIYLRYFDPVYAYVRVGLRDHHAAEDIAQQVFIKALEALPEFELRPGKPFRAWLFKIARNQVLGHLRKEGRLDFEDPNDIDERREVPTAAGEVNVLDWISDDDLMLFVERLPEPQRRTLVLRYMLGLSTEEIGTVLDRTPVAVRKLEHRALRFLESRLAAIGRGPKRATRRAPTLIRMRRMTVVRARRYALGTQAAAGPRR